MHGHDWPHAAHTCRRPDRVRQCVAWISAARRSSCADLTRSPALGNEDGPAGGMAGPFGGTGSRASLAGDVLDPAGGTDPNRQAGEAPHAT